MSNLTLKIEDELLDKIKIYAVHNKISLSALIRDYFEKIIDISNINEEYQNNSEYEILKNYSNREISVFDVMRQLDIERFDVYPLLEKYKLDLPQESDSNAILSAKKIAKIIQER